MRKGEKMTKEQKLLISVNRKGKLFGVLNPSYKGGLLSVKCMNCQSIIKRHPSMISTKIYCSRKCYSVYMKSDPKFGSWNKGLIRSEEFKKKISLSNLGRLSGNRHPRWISDRTKLVKRQERNDVAYKDWRKQVWLRDNFTCKIANPDCSGRIEAHHILGWTAYPELRYQLNNGITLCHAHHPRKRADEAKLSPYFQKLVAEMK